MVEMFVEMLVGALPVLGGLFAAHFLFPDPGWAHRTKPTAEADLEKDRRG